MEVRGQVDFGEIVKILILEDDDGKFEQIQNHINGIMSDCDIQRVKNWLDYSNAINRIRFDLILLDLFVPRSPKDKTVEDHHGLLVETTRSYDSISFCTPAIVLTRYSQNEGDFVQNLNNVDINVIPFNDYGDWKEALKIKLLAARPKKKFEFVIVCALDKEMNAYESVADSIGPIRNISGLVCREVKIDKYKGVVVRANRMGLVASAIAATMALERFEPRLVCMSGICGGISGEADIYDLLVTQMCYQHDAGKWSNAGFKAEPYAVQLDVEIQNKLIEICADNELNKSLTEIVIPSEDEMPTVKGEFVLNIKSDAVTSSGCAVMAQDEKTSELNQLQRKLSGFDMEIYSIYEAARHASQRTAFFAAKTVVDDGGNNKGDRFHRVGCLISAGFVTKAVPKLMEGINKA